MVWQKCLPLCFSLFPVINPFSKLSFTLYILMTSSQFESLELCHHNTEISLTKWPFIKLEPSRYCEHLSTGHKTRKVWQVYCLASYCLWPGLQIMELLFLSERQGSGFSLSRPHIPIFPEPLLRALCSSVTELTVLTTPTADDATNLLTYCSSCQSVICSAS